MKKTIIFVCLLFVITPVLTSIVDSESTSQDADLVLVVIYGRYTSFRTDSQGRPYKLYAGGNAGYLAYFGIGEDSHPYRSYEMIKGFGVGSIEYGESFFRWGLPVGRYDPWVQINQTSTFFAIVGDFER